MPFLSVIEPPKLCWTTKSAFFEFATLYKPQLHDRHKIVRSDIKLSNMLLNGSVVKFCDFGTSAWILELKSIYDVHEKDIWFHGD